ncbi:MAG: hypothetical protein GY909_15995 [Oligoflexia bacterium]|nr:hypothetical protein [Oligoflexia bacterium]
MKIKKILFSFTTYQNNNAKALVGHIDYDGSSFGYEDVVLSLNFGQSPSENCFWIKHYSGHEHIYEYLVSEGFLVPTGRLYKSGFVNVPEAMITDKLRSSLL